MKIVKTREVKTPTRGTPGSAGLDFYVPEDFEMTVHPGMQALIPTGVRVRVPRGHALVALNKSGVATKKQMVVGAQLIDEDYTGEVHVHLINVGRTAQVVRPGDKVAQFVAIPVAYPEVEVTDEGEAFGDLVTERGEGAFGSTDSK